MSNFFIVIAIISVSYGIFSSMKIVSYLSDHGVKINYFLLRLLLPKYVGQYRKMMIEKHGKPGFWYYSFVISMIFTLIMALIGIVLKLNN